MLIVEKLDPRDRAAAQQVADLHLKYLSDSPVVQFGPRFLRQFYYGKLLSAGLIEATIGRDGNQVVAFISYTKDSLDFMQRGVRRWPFYLSWLMLRSLLARPALARDLWTVFRLMRERSQEASSSAEQVRGEVLSLVVAESHRAQVPAGGRSRLTVRLFEEVVEFYRGAGLDKFYLLVQPSNRASNIFCASMGCRFEKVMNMGMPVHRYTYQMPEPVPQHEVESGSTS
jgi:hypothetical protein